MAMEIVTFINDSKGKTLFGRETVALHLGISDFLSTSPLMSDANPCKRYFFTELPSGFHSNKDFSSRRQICVLLSGELEIMATNGHTESFVAGDVLRLEDTNFQTPGRIVRVLSECPARILNVQID